MNTKIIFLSGSPYAATQRINDIISDFKENSPDDSQ